ncbi:hypothetical protein T06_137 [Trichinella sp. T6]|nr:hypothetical protein T06_137 [Trichinella sp. T6]
MHYVDSNEQRVKVSGRDNFTDIEKIYTHGGKFSIPIDIILLLKFTGSCFTFGLCFTRDHASELIFEPCIINSVFICKRLQLTVNLCHSFFIIIFCPWQFSRADFQETTPKSIMQMRSRFSTFFNTKLPGFTSLCK